MFKKLLSRLFPSKKRTSESYRLELQNKIKSLEPVLGFVIENESVYLKALTHRSFLELHPELEKSNERLEFLGDSILSMIVAEYLFTNYPEEEEGFLTKARSALVNRDRLYDTAANLNLKDYLLFNNKYLGGTLEGLQTVLADAVEALIGAIFLDKGLIMAEKFIHKFVIAPYEENGMFLIDTNYKGQLLEYTHSKKLETPRYVVTKIDGPEHKREFTVEVIIGNITYGTGTGRNKKTAEQNASCNALKFIQSNH